MSNYKAGTFKWFSKKEISEMLAEENSGVLDALAEQGVHIVKGGLWNIKAPDPVFYTDKPYKLSNSFIQLAESNSNIVIKQDGFIGIRDKRLTIVYEG